jgi:small conductance mechanosensitive channel
MNTNLQQVYDSIIEFAFSFGPKIIGAILVWIIGSWVIKLLGKGLNMMFEKSKLEVSLKTFLHSLITITLKILLLISVLGMLGIEMTSFIAILGAAGLAFGMAMSGTLQNFAGGVMLLIFKPFKVGDLIESQGRTGVVKEIQIFVTILVTPDHKTIILPNGAVANHEITNYATEGTIRVDLDFGIGYGDSIDKAKKALMEVMEQHPLVLKQHQPFVGVHGLGDSSVNLSVRPYTEPKNYWEVYFDLYEKGKKALDQAGIEIPFPQRVVHTPKS